MNQCAYPTGRLGVGGSNPLAPTIFFNKSVLFLHYQSLSDRWFAGSLQFCSSRVLSTPVVAVPALSGKHLELSGTTGLRALPTIHVHNVLWDSRLAGDLAPFPAKLSC